MRAQRVPQQHRSGPQGEHDDQQFRSARDRLTVDDAVYDVFRLDQVEGSARLPYSLKVRLENLLRNEDISRVRPALLH